MREATIRIPDGALEELGIDPSTVREHRQRAQRNLVGGVLASDRGRSGDG